MKGCELCGKGGEAGVGMMYCEADSARLCWECDAAVHGANFLVAKHTRVLLCHACHAPTQWRASGSSLSPALSICPACRVAKEDSNEEEEVEEEGYSWSGTDEDEGEGENQVVPWSPVRAAAEAVGGGSSVASSSSSDDGGGLKRLRDDGGDSDLDHDDSEDETSSLPLRKRPRKLLVDAQPQHNNNNNQEQNSLHQSCRGRNGSTDEIIKRLRKGMSKNEETTILRTQDTNNID